MYLLCDNHYLKDVPTFCAITIILIVYTFSMERVSLRFFLGFLDWLAAISASSVSLLMKSCGRFIFGIGQIIWVLTLSTGVHNWTKQWHGGLIGGVDLSSRVRASDYYIEWIHNVACSVRLNPMAVYNLLFSVICQSALSGICLRFILTLVDKA